MKLAQIKAITVLALSFFSDNINKAPVRKVARQFWEGLDELFDFTGENDVERK